MKFIKKEDRENIDKLNMLMGTNHRSKPYDLKKDEDLIEATAMATAEYVDLEHYFGILSNLSEAFDESMEFFYPDEWINIGLKGTMEDEDLSSAVESLSVTEDLFHILVDRAETKCIKLWKLVLLESSDDVIRHFFGETKHFDKETVENVLEDNLFEVLDEMEYDRVIENSVKNFAKALGKILEEESAEE